MARTKYSIYMPRVRELREHPSRLNEVWKFYLGTVGMADCPLYYHNTREPRLDEVTKSCPSCLGTRPQVFVTIVNNTIGTDDDEVVLCAVCNKPEWNDDTHCDVDSNSVCDDCRSNYASCRHCEDWSIGSSFLTWVEGYSYCEPCRDNRCSYCDDCESWYHDDNAGDHEHEPDYCGCNPQELRFKILANSHGILHQDERLLVELAEGHITDEAVNAVCQMLWNDQLRSDYTVRPDTAPHFQTIYEAIFKMDRTWQTKQGNFTRRLSKTLYEMGVKLDTGLLSRAGSRVKEHAGSTNKWHIEFTRDLNQPPSAFYHEDSCWWSSENASLCSFKHWGGVGLRSYSSEGTYRDSPTGRAWVQPLNGNMEPTHEVYDAHAYVVYNGYGALEGYTAARLVAYLTSRTYRKIGLEVSYQYVNSSNFLVADQETCDATESIVIAGLGSHERVAA